MIALTPKYLLHHKHCVSDLEDMTPRTCFQPFIADGSRFDNCKHLHPSGLRLCTKNQRQQALGDGVDVDEPAASVKRVILCTGKVYYHLVHARRARKIVDVVLGRVEELAPFPHNLIAKWVRQYPNAEVCWVQEEPKNLGFWHYVQPRIETALRTFDRDHQGHHTDDADGEPLTEWHGTEEALSEGESQSTAPFADRSDVSYRVRYIGRPPAQSPATGSVVTHMSEMDTLFDQALGQ